MSRQDRILIVDDHPANIEILEDILGEDYRLETATCGEEALELAVAFRPALILLDIMMPGLDGYATCAQLRANPAFSRVKILMVSARALDAERLKGYEAGADDYITKPFNLDELRAKVRVYLRLSSLEEVNQLKSDVLALLSHETVTPINGILGPLQLLRDTPEMAAEERQEFLEAACESAERLHLLYSKVRTFCAMRADAWPWRPETTDLGDLTQEVVTEWEPEATAKGVSIEVVRAGAAVAALDRTCMRDVIRGLVDNAVRFSPASGRVVIEVEPGEERVVLRVQDEGAGIAPEALGHIFEPFAPGDIQHHHTGHGLSLAIARQVIEAHDGAIEVESVVGEGTTVKVWTPAVVRGQE